MTIAVSNNRTSVLVPSQLPEFIRSEHNTFVQFIQSYYRFLEDSTYKKAVRSNLFVSTEIGPSGAYQNTSNVRVSANVRTSNVALSNGAKVSIDGHITFAKNVNPNNSFFTVDPPIPTRIVQGDFFIYESRSSSANNQLMDVTKNWNRYKDIDIATTDNEQIKQKLYDNFIKVLPKNLVADKTLIAKHAKEFYRSKGSENSVKFLLRALYNTESEFYYPKQDILRASDGKWYVEKAIRVTDTMVNNVANSIVYNNFIGREITGMQSQAKAIVEGVNVYYRSGALVTELTVSNSDKPFLSNEKIYTFYQDTETSGTLFASATIFGGQIVDTEIVSGGTGYLVGMEIPVIPTDNTGNGAKIVVSRVTRGGINRIYVGTGDVIGLPDDGGVGYRVDDPVLVSGGGGTGALGGVEFVTADNFYHPNTYNLTSTTFADVADYNIGDYWDVTPNLNINSGDDIANTTVANAANYWTFGPSGPARFIYVVDEGENYGTALPTFTVLANTRIKNLGILGKMKIINGGLNYVIGDTIEFVNRPYFSYGTGATANVTNVAANGMITEVKFQRMEGHIIGGSGYNQTYLPTCNVVTSTGNGANIVVTNILGTGGNFSFTTESLGIIRAIRILEGGSGYVSTPILDLTGIGDGTAQVTATSVTGIYAYPGRYISDDGFLSSKNKLQDRDYYQNFSYVIKSRASINRYRPMLKSLTHPAGMKMFGSYEVINTERATMNASQTFDTSNTATVSNTGISLYLDSANTIDTFTGVGYEFTVYDFDGKRIFSNTTNTYAISLDDTSYYDPTTWVDLSDMSYVGLIYNGAFINPETGILKFDGTNEFSYFPVASKLDSQTLTVEAWFAPENLFENGMIMEKGFRNEQYSILIEKVPATRGSSPDTELIWRLALDGAITNTIRARSSRFLRLGWNHVAVTHTAGAQTMYINGKFAGSNNRTGLLASPPYGLSIGSSGATSGPNPSRSYYFEGNIGVIRIYNRVLTPTEIIKNFGYERERYGL